MAKSSLKVLARKARRRYHIDMLKEFLNWNRHFTPCTRIREMVPSTPSFLNWSLPSTHLTRVERCNLRLPRNFRLFKIQLRQRIVQVTRSEMRTIFHEDGFHFGRMNWSL